MQFLHHVISLILFFAEVKCQGGVLAVVLTLGNQHTQDAAAGILGVLFILSFGFCRPLRLFPESMKFDDS